MRLRHLVRASGTSAASIKFYLREGLLPPGRSVNATLAEYDERHLTRLRLIRTLRWLDVPMPRIKLLTDAIDGDLPLSRLLGMAQLVALGREPTLAAESALPSPQLDRVAGELGWSADPVEMRDAVADQLASMAERGIEVTDDALLRYARAADGLAVGDAEAALTADTRDDAVRVVAEGTAAFGRLLLRLAGYAAASRVVRSPEVRSGPLSGSSPG